MTEASKNTLVSGATRNGMTLIAVAMRADAGQVCQDHINLFNYGFDNFQKVEVPGGSVTIPNDVQVSVLTDTDNNYYFGTDYYVGSGSEQTTQEQQDEPTVMESEEDTPTPEDNVISEKTQENKTIYRYVIYILVGLIIITVVLTIVSAIRKSMRKKKRKQKR